MRLNEIQESDDHLMLKYKSAIDFAIEKFKKDIAIYRGSTSIKMYSDKRIIYSNPTTRSTDRKSSNSFNYYNLWMSNNPQWSSFPKRGKSLICTTSLKTASSYGKPKIVVPLLDCKIGVCPKEDLWYSFTAVNSLFELTTWLYNHFSEQWPDQDNENITYPQLLQKLNNTRYNVNADRRYIDLENLLKKYNNAEDVIELILNPSKNNFILTTWAQFNNKFNDTDTGLEVWLSSPVLLIDPYYFSNLVARDTNAPV